MRLYMCVVVIVIMQMQTWGIIRYKADGLCTVVMGIGCTSTHLGRVSAC